MRSPKLYWGDTGIALYLANSTSPSGEHLENLILCDLMSWRDSSVEQTDLFYWRTADGIEVDLVVEHKGQLIPIEVKSSASVRPRDAKNLIEFRKEYKKESRRGLLIYDGNEVVEIVPGILAVPWWKMI